MVVGVVFAYIICWVVQMYKKERKKGTWELGFRVWGLFFWCEKAKYGLSNVVIGSVNEVAPELFYRWGMERGAVWGWRQFKREWGHSPWYAVWVRFGSCEGRRWGPNLEDSWLLHLALELQRPLDAWYLLLLFFSTVRTNANLFR